jgi:iron complex transport system substrate-binding protein
MKRLSVFCMLLLAAPCFGARSITDELGRTVQIPDRPHRLICIMPNVADDVYSLGAGDAVIAVSDFTRYPAEATKKPSIGLPLSPSIEKIVSLHPDLVIGSGDLNSMEVADRLQQSGIALFMVNPHGIDGIYRSLATLGKALNREAGAATLIARLKAREMAARRRGAGKPIVRVFMPIWYDPVITIGRNAFITELIEAAGGKSITDDIAQEWPQVSMETVVSRSPDAILLVQGPRMTGKILSSQPGWQALAAVKAERFYYADERMNYPSPVAFDALEDLAKQFHP